MTTFPLAQVTAAIARRGYSGRAAAATTMVLAEGLSITEAARRSGVDPAAVSRFLKRFTVFSPCPCCGQPVKKYQL